MTEEQPEWNGTATELAEMISGDLTPISLSMRLNVRAGRLMEEYHIRYEPTRTHAGRRIRLTLIHDMA